MRSLISDAVALGSYPAKVRVKSLVLSPLLLHMEQGLSQLRKDTTSVSY